MALVALDASPIRIGTARPRFSARGMLAAAIYLVSDSAVSAVFVLDDTNVAFLSSPRGTKLTPTCFLVDDTAVQAIGLRQRAAATGVAKVWRGALLLAGLNTFACF